MVNEAITMLNKYLEVNQIDEEAWAELADIYLSRQNYPKAMFCYEELITAHPTNYLYFIRYAEIMYSTAVGAQNNMEMLENARKYFAHSLVLIDELSETKVAVNVVRALWGLVKVCKQINLVAKKEDLKNQKMLKIS